MEVKINAGNMVVLFLSHDMLIYCSYGSTYRKCYILYSFFIYENVIFSMRLIWPRFHQSFQIFVHCNIFNSVNLQRINFLLGNHTTYYIIPPFDFWCNQKGPFLAEIWNKLKIDFSTINPPKYPPSIISTLKGLIARSIMLME